MLYEALHSPFFDMLGNTLTLERVGGDLKSFLYFLIIFFPKIGDSGPHCTNNQTVAELDPEIPMCPQQNVFAPLLFGVYMVLTNVLLLNLLIAMFRLEQEFKKKI